MSRFIDRAVVVFALLLSTTAIEPSPTCANETVRCCHPDNVVSCGSPWANASATLFNKKLPANLNTLCGLVCKCTLWNQGLENSRINVLTALQVYQRVHDRWELGSFFGTVVNLMKRNFVVRMVM
jgi:hypothetical protein